MTKPTPRFAGTATIIMTATALLVSACTDGPPDPAPAETDATDAASAGDDGSGQDLQGTLSVYAAASLGEAFDDLLGHFDADHPQVTITDPVYDGSSTLVTQLIEGAPADVLATADEITMAELLDSGLVDADDAEPVDIATNTMVIAVPDTNPEQVRDLEDLEDLSYAVCAPQVPCGHAAEELFTQAGMPMNAISEEQNVTAVARRVASGSIDAGLVYTTDVAGREDDLEAITPSGDPVVNTYPIITITENPVAEAFTEYVQSEQGRQILADYGFGEP